MTTTAVPPSSSLLATLGSVPATELAGSRLTLHWASQPVASFGFSVLPARDDYSHTALHWVAAHGTLATDKEPETGIYAALDVTGFALGLWRDDDRLAHFPLRGRTLDEAFGWLETAIQEAGIELSGSVVRPGHLGDVPAHPVADGASFEEPAVAHGKELAAWLELADATLQWFRGTHPEAGAILLWPHHFDMASLHVLEGEGESMRSVGAGVSLGDGSYAQPYVYVNPWPAPQGAELPELPAGGQWHTEGWTGAVLRGDRLLEIDGGEARAEGLLRFISTAHAAGVELSNQGKG
ncbi:MAG: hypothetical protein AAF799_38995 [Myxococcota bacterium]